MRRILLPTDFSENAGQAMDYACSYFSGQQCEFYILNVQKAGEFVMDDLMQSKPGSSIHKAIAADNKEVLSQLTEEYRKRFEEEPFTFSPLFDFDILADAMKQTVKREGIDLIVMGTNGASGAKEAIFGSNTIQVIRKVPCPVLAVPEGFKYKVPEQLMISVIDGSYPDEEEVAVLIDFLGARQAQIHILAISEEEMDLDKRKEHEQKVGSLMPSLDLAFHYLEGIPVPMAINAFVQLHHIDLHALHVERESFLQRFIYGSATSTISYNSQVPLLVLNMD